MKTWRPKGWVNPYLQKDENGDWIDSRCFEAGADAMLEILRNNQLSPFDTTVMQANFKGRVVIIPDDEDKKNKTSTE